MSDTHGLLRKEVMEIVDSCDVVIHAGDIDSQEIVDKLGERVSLYAVRGNNDIGWTNHLSSFLRFYLGGLRFYVTHVKENVPDGISDVDIIIYGHSHQYSQKEKEGILWLNPGSCGKSRFTLPVTMAVMTIDNGTYQIERINFLQQKKGKKKILTIENDLYNVVRYIMKRMGNGESIEKMARKLCLEVEEVEHICRIIVTHPGVSIDGIIDRIET